MEIILLLFKNGMIVYEALAPHSGRKWQNNSFKEVKKRVVYTFCKQVLVQQIYFMTMP